MARRYSNDFAQTSIVRWLIFPMLLVAATFLFSTNVAFFKSNVPNIAPFSNINRHAKIRPTNPTNSSFSVNATHATYNTTYNRATVFLQVDSVVKAFQIGRLYQEYQQKCYKGGDKGGDNGAISHQQCEDIELQVSNVTKISRSKARQFLWSQSDFGNIQLYESYLKKAAGFITLTNSAMVVGAILIVIPIAPILSIAIGAFVPLIEKIYPHIVKILVALVPFYESIAYIVSFTISTQSIFYDGSVSHYVAFLGALLSLASFFVSTVLHAPSEGGREKEFASLVGGYVVLTFSPLAIVYQSTLLGFFATCGLYTALGFSIIPYGLCTAIGFDSKNSLERCASTSILFILCSTLLPHLNVPTEIRSLFEPFRFGIFALGGSVYFLATLIIASKYYDNARDVRDYRQFSSTYWTRQIYFLVPLFAFFSVGNIYAIPALVNTAGTFFFIYFMEKYTEIMWETKNVVFWILTFVGGVILWFSALYLKTHPDLISLVFVPL